MNDPNRLAKWLLVIGMVVLSLLILYPPSQKLKGGIDLVGGTSLLFEIDTTGLDSAMQQDLSTRVMRILKERVDPGGQLNLEWRPVGNSRLEIRMPRPPKEALERREAYNAALNELRDKNVSRRELEEALNAPPEQRESMLARLERGIEARGPALDELQAAYESYLVAQEGDDPAAREEGSAAYEEAMAAVLATNFAVNRLNDVLVLAKGTQREEELERLRTEYPSFDEPEGEAADVEDAGGGLLSEAVAAYDAWAANKADLEDPSDLKRRLRGAGVLEFWILADRDPSSPAFTKDPKRPELRQEISKYTKQLQKYGPRPQPGDRYRWIRIEDVRRFLDAKTLEEVEQRKDQPGSPIIEEYTGQYYVLAHRDPGYRMLAGGPDGGAKPWKLVAAYPDRDPMTGENVVSFQLDPRGGQLFGELTGNNEKRELCIVLDDQAVSFATIQERITERCRISGRFTPERVNELVTTLEAGSLPARLKETPLSEVTIGPSLGQTNREKGMQAAVWGFGAVVVFMLIYYGFAAGGMADIALCLNLLFVLAVMALMQATFTLPGIAGLILTVGMAVDANVLIFERIREERDRGIVFKKALNAGYDKAFSTIFDANLTTLITCIVLGFVGSEEVKGFAVVLGIGITTSMFTALFVTRLVFNTLIAKGWLKNLHMRRLIGRPQVNWLGLRRTCFTISVIAAGAGATMFAAQSFGNKEAIFDIEFLGGTSVQIDLKPGEEMTDEEVRKAITSTEPGSATGWLAHAAEVLPQATVEVGEAPGQYRIHSDQLTAEQISALIQTTIEDIAADANIQRAGRTVTVSLPPGRLTIDGMREAIETAAQGARAASDRLRTARVQSVGEVDPETHAGSSFEVATIETDRGLVQEAIVAVLGDRLSVQLPIDFTVVEDERMTKDEHFVIEQDDHYLSDVIGGDVSFDIRPYRGGVAVQVVLDEAEEPLPPAEFERRMLEVALQPEFEQLRTRESEVIPLGEAFERSDGKTGYERFAVVAIDDALIYDPDPVRAQQWTDQVATKQVALVKAALGSEKSLSKVIQFAPQIAKQTRNRAIFAVVLALAAIVAYLWFRFGSKEYGLAAIVALVHDVTITLGMVALSYYVYDTILGTALLIDDFKVDLPMIAAILTVIGYSLNDTIVVFDRIRENRGKASGLTANIINDSINQTISRTLLTSGTTFLVVGLLYALGGSGVHGFSFALLAGVIVGTYSSIGVASPLLYQPNLLRAVVAAIVALLVIGVVVVEVESSTWRWGLAVVVGALGVYGMIRSWRTGELIPTGQPVGA